MFRAFSRIALVLAVLAQLAVVRPAIAQTDVEREVTALYGAFAAAQNDRDPERVRPLLWSDPGFLWISDGKPFWGRDAMLARMSMFQKSAVWRVTPDFERARIVEIGPNTAMLFQPLTLRLGSQDDAADFRFLVNVMCVRTALGWRISALLTTEERPQ